MQGNKAHLSDEELLLFSDQELPTRQAATVREHVAQCESCRGRLTALENASACFADLHQQEFQAQSFHSVHARNLLKTRLSGSGSRRATFWNVVTQQLAGACLALMLVVGGIWTVRHIMRAETSLDATKGEAIALPRRTLTPGSTRAVQVADLCSSQELGNDPPVSSSLEQAVFREYGVPASSRKDYELDYLITPALGGVDSIQNLWPQPHSSTWNARVKDQLEDHLHELVCQGRLQLATAQSDIASDWIAAYKRYFNTDKPQSGVGSRPELDSNHRHQAESRLSGIYDLALSVPSWQPPASRAVLRRTAAP